MFLYKVQAIADLEFRHRETPTTLLIQREASVDRQQ